MPSLWQVMGGCFGGCFRSSDSKTTASQQLSPVNVSAASGTAFFFSLIGPCVGRERDTSLAGSSSFLFFWGKKLKSFQRWRDGTK